MITHSNVALKLHVFVADLFARARSSDSLKAGMDLSLTLVSAMRIFGGTVALRKSSMDS